MDRLEEIEQRAAKASPGPWEGCAHVRDFALDKKCHCGASDVWSIPADTMVVSAYREKDDEGKWRGGPPQVSREQELNNLTFVAHAREDIPYLLDLIRAYQRECNEVEQVAGKALGYPWYKDDQKNFPGSTEKNGVCVGEHVPVTIVMELARKYEEKVKALKKIEEIANREWPGLENSVLRFKGVTVSELARMAIEGDLNHEKP